jgi:hypothetical protein
MLVATTQTAPDRVRAFAPALLTQTVFDVKCERQASSLTGNALNRNVGRSLHAAPVAGHQHAAGGRRSGRNRADQRLSGASWSGARILQIPGIAGNLLLRRVRAA